MGLHCQKEAKQPVLVPDGERSLGHLANMGGEVVVELIRHHLSCGTINRFVGAYAPDYLMDGQVDSEALARDLEIVWPW